MSAFKKLQSGDSITVGYTAKKNWVIENGSFEGYTVDYTQGLFTSSLQIYLNDSDYDEKLKYRSLQQLYYGNVKDSSTYSTGSYFTYEQTTLSIEEKRTLDSELLCISFPKDLIGSSIEPGTFTMYYDEPVENDIIYKDNGEGKLIKAGITKNTGDVAGDIIYTHGIIIITDTGSANTVNDNKDKIDFTYTSNYDVFTTTYNIRLQDSEFNFTQNPSTNSGSLLNDNVTGSEFSPYITTVGLYNDASELIAVAKLSRPIPKSKSTDMTIVINLDM